MKRCVFALLFYIFTFLESSGQGLEIGDKVPDPELVILNYPKTKVKLSEFDNQIIILDFWNTWCSACIAGFSRMDELQKKYPVNSRHVDPGFLHVDPPR